MQYSNNETINIDTPYSCLYCLVMAVWSTVLMEVWKRRQNEIAHLWNVANLNKSSEERDEFKADLMIDNELHSVRRINTVHT
jgi:Calcium-activated chloride channel